MEVERKLHFISICFKYEYSSAVNSEEPQHSFYALHMTRQGQVALHTVIHRKSNRSGRHNFHVVDAEASEEASPAMLSHYPGQPMSCGWYVLTISLSMS